MLKEEGRRKKERKKEGRTKMEEGRRKINCQFPITNFQLSIT
jgi:hypothetical protein